MKIRVILLIIIFALLFVTAGCAGGGAEDNSVGGGAGGGAGDSVLESDADDAVEGADCGGPTGEGQGGAAGEGQGGAGGAGQNGPERGVVLQDLGGNSFALSDFKGEVVVLNFWASWCPPCRQEMPELNELDMEFKESGDAVLITVNLTDGQRETVDTARQFIEESGYGFLVLLDEESLLARRFNISAIPQTFILDREGNITGSIIGSTTRAAILAEVNAAG